MPQIFSIKNLRNTLAEKNGAKGMKLWPGPKMKNYEKNLDFKETLTFGGSILTIGLDLLTFEPLTNFSVSPKIWIILNFKISCKFAKK